MGGTLANYNFGGDGVNLVKNPLQLADTEATALQNAELVPDQNKGGEGALSKRAGLAPLNGTPLAGAIYGMVSLPLQTNFTRTIYVFTNTNGPLTAWKSTDGTTWTSTALPLQHRLDSQEAADNVSFSGRRCAGIRTVMIYPGTNYSAGVTNPTLVFYDGTTGAELTQIPKSYAGTIPGTISDILVANGKIYIASMENVTTNQRGAVYELNLDTGYMQMVAAAFGGGTGQQTGGAPSCLAWHQGRLFVGQAQFSSTSSHNDGQLVSCYPGIDSAWTVEGSPFNGVPVSLCEFLGDLYIGTFTEDASAVGGVVKRAAATGTYSQVYSTSSAGQAHVASLTVFNGILFGVEYFNSVTDILHVKSSVDGTTWLTDLDVDSTLSGNLDTPVAQRPGGLLVFPTNNKMYFVARTLAGSDTSATGYLYERTTAGVWTARLSAKGLLGPMVVLTERS